MPIETLVFSSLALATLAVLGLGLPLPSPTVQVVLLGVLVGVLGLPHGALDPLIARRVGLWRTPLGFAGFNAAYILVVVGVVLLWLVAPVASLVVFLLVSALHFGSDWNADRALWLRFLAGFGLLSVPALSHPEQVSAAYVVLAGDGGAMVARVQEWLGPLALAGLLLAALVALRHRAHESVEIVLATVLALATEPLVFFLLYFCALHSFRHLKAGFHAERGGGRLPALMVVVYTVVPLLVVGVLLVSLGTGGAMSEQILQVVFIGLAALTVPHMIVVARENRHRRAAVAGQQETSPI
ncbi:MAG: Brp/Blh family beta-carotene 15,15'-dioxygenase [Cryobacterium sp.]|uniref:Brp/Blh family beta-carotene 15,15'-dioxygenase n=1 Tax=unclassified Cryobacterium TaxID=2649013 RepID=UPI0018CBB39A|nr:MULTISPECIES: Brp/Blh family beta-carotene 15,15'-dioxygenase [unclassified Cryobacterium]MCY7405230.1 Brp/Blh family beta-carotene 15,15'-dioxygenase [Cryobacterium sp.]